MIRGFVPEKHYIKILGQPRSRGLFSKKSNFCLRKLVFRVLFVSKIIACQSLCMFYFVLLNFPVLNCRFCAHVLRNCVGVVIFRRVNSQFYTYHYVPPISRRPPQQISLVTWCPELKRWISRRTSPKNQTIFNDFQQKHKDSPQRILHVQLLK